MSTSSFDSEIDFKTTKKQIHFSHPYQTRSATKAMATSTLTEKISKTTEAPKKDHQPDFDIEGLVTKDFAFRILKEEKQKFLENKILPFSTKLKKELLNGTELSEIQQQTLSEGHDKDNLFPCLDINGEKIIYFFGEIVSQKHDLGRQIIYLNKLDKKTVKMFIEELHQIVKQILYNMRSFFIKQFSRSIVLNCKI